MLIVTAKAREKLKEALQEEAHDLEIGVRIVVSPAVPGQLQFVLDRAKEGDQVVEDEAGLKLLLIEPELARALEGMVIDYQEGPKEGFTISRITPETS